MPFLRGQPPEEAEGLEPQLLGVFGTGGILPERGGQAEALGRATEVPLLLPLLRPCAERLGAP